MLALTCLQLLLLLMCLFPATASLSDIQCEPAEIGTNHSISCSSRSNVQYISWMSYTGSSLTELTLFRCYTINTSCLPTLNQIYNSYNATMENQYQNINGLNKSVLYIYNINTDSRIVFKCSINLEPKIEVCNPLEIFSKPEGIKCNDNLMINEQNMIPIVCFLTKVYPAAKMLLNCSSLSKTVTCVNDTSSTFGSIKCQSDIPVAGMKAGVNFIDVIIYPDVTRGERFGDKKQLNISLTFPTPSLGQDCENILNTTQGYIKQGTPANCTCYVKTQGVPPGGVRWFYNNGTEVGSGSGSESAVLQMIFFGKENNQSYRCVGVSALGKDNQEKEFTIKNAYGPEQLYLSTNETNSIYDICLPNKIINIICSLPRQSVAPEPNVTISVSDGESLVIKSSQNSNNYMFMSSYTPKTVGELHLKCEAVNQVFKDLRNSSTSIVFIAGPPSLPPYLTIGQQSNMGQNEKTVESQKEGSKLEITCEVSGGFPNTYNMTLSCDGSYNNSATNSDVVKLSIEKVGRQLNGKQCVCKAEHVTSCYVNNTFSVILNITFPAEVNQFTANSNSSSLTVSNNSDVIFVCDTESNPPATVEIIKTESIVSNTGRLNFTKRVMCQDSGEYYCKAHNSEFSKQNQSTLILYILCSIQLRNENERYRVFPAYKGNNAVIKFDVLGFPAPVSYSLFKKELEHEYLLTNFSSDGLVKPKYQIDFMMGSLSYGTISISIFNLIDQDFTNYTLNINNRIDTDTKLSFALMQAKEIDDEILPAVIGGVIGSLAFIIFIIIIIIFMGETHHKLLWKKLKGLRHHQYAEQDHQNSDIYIFKSKNGSGMEIIYKNYSDVPITITTATALPKNLKLKSKPALMPTYFNSVDDCSSEFSFKEADTSHLIKKDIKTNDLTNSYTRDISGYQNNNSDVYANT